MNSKSSSWTVLKCRSQIYGFCALWIMIFHIEKHIGIPWDIPFITPFIQMGNAGVDIFMLLSGFCLSLSYARNPDWRSFYKKRVVRVVIPYLIIAIPFYLWKSIWQHPLPDGHMNFLGFIADVTGYSFWRSGMLTSWFVAAIIVFYLAFPIIYKFVKVSKWFALSAFIPIYAFIVLTDGFGFSIAVSRFPAFYLGVVMACYEMTPKVNKTSLILSAAFILLVVGIFPVKTLMLENGISPTYLWSFYITMSLPIMLLLSAVFQQGKAAGGGIFTFAGNYSLEIYLIHVMILNITNWSGLNAVIGYWMYLLLPAITIPLSVMVSKLAKLIKV